MASIKPPSSGSTIDRADITEMFESLRSTVNNLGSEHIGRASFGPQHFNPGDVFGNSISAVTPGVCGIVERSDSNGFDRSAAVPAVGGTGPGIAEATSETFASGWTELTALRLNGPGSVGYALNPGIIVGYYSLRLPRWYRHADMDEDDEASTIQHANWWTIAGVSYTINSVEAGIPESVRLIRCLSHLPGDSQKYQEQNFSCWYILDTSNRTTPFKLDSLKVRVGKMRTNTDTNFPDSTPQIAQGYHMFMALKAQS
ncbi:MAG: hypothetical protein Unbinned2514contig1000_25 [Prokaryotic dsDNA virus sp.]|nr:MAG: hypothetical protein Unbinned2514contig1000_25 [Prokaryotic dsDNA virus sp.]|tara:strand:- start:3166 stop:3936 length:771 start_codon:yes stop_codon:yes gene_type:complete